MGGGGSTQPNCKVNVSGKAFGLTNPDETVWSIALQEIGHALGLLHVEGSAAPDDVMYGTLRNPPNTRISFCDLDAWAAVMAWLLQGTAPALPSVPSVSCGTAPPGSDAEPAAVAVQTDKRRSRARQAVPGVSRGLVPPSTRP